MTISGKVIFRALALLLASNAAVLFVLKFGLLIWPERLPVNSQNIFWLASGVNVAGLLLLGLRYWPVLLLNAFPAWLLLGEPLEMCALGSATNAAEAFFAAWFIQRAGAFSGRFDRIRSVGALLGASLLAPLANTLVIPAYLCAVGLFPWAEYGRALGNWNLANGAGMLFLTPLIVAIAQRDWSPGPRVFERTAAALVVAALSFIGFDAMFRGVGMNLAFLAFPALIYVAVRFGIGETAVALGVTLVSVYVAIFLHGSTQSANVMPSIIWFVQAISWVLAATGLLVAALDSERRLAELHSLEASLIAERARLAALRYQINPHFLFNTLNSIRAALPLSETVAREMITDLSGYLRSTLDSGEADQVALRDEVRSAQEYLRIEQRRFGERLQTRFEIDPAIEEKRVPAFLLQPLLENAIRHGLQTTRQPCQLSVTARREGDRLHLRVANTGKWREPGERAGVGLDNIRRRLALLHGSAAHLRVAETDGFVCVDLELPI